MSMSTEATEWLEKHRPGRFIADLTRAGAAPERIEVGDVLDDGSILTIRGLLITGGAVWLNARKANAAAYYGWRLIGPERGRCLRTGECLYPMTR